MRDYFPTINHINDILPAIANNPQFRVAEQPNGTTVICYMLQDDQTFSGEHEAWYKECRGITFHTDGSVACRPLHKFVNVGENESVQPDLIPWDRIVRVLPKLDGSMITFVLLPDGSIKGKTKKTFTSNEAIAATEWLYRDQYRLELVREWLRAGYTPIFEWTSPRFPIVLTYEKEELTLLHIRKNDTGEYLLKEIDRILPEAFPFSIVPNLLKQFPDPRELLQLAKTAEGIEGWVIQTDDGEMFKIKTASYVQLHKSVTFCRYRDVARTICEDKADDLKAAFAMTGRSIEPIILIEREISEAIKRARELVEELVSYGRNQDWSVKDMALTHKENSYFGLIMRVFKGQEVNWLEWYLKNHVPYWSLEVIPTSVQNEELEVE